MDVKALPAELTLRQLAEVLGLTVPAIRYRVKTGVIPSRRIGPSDHARLVVPLDVVHRDFPELYNAIVFRTQQVDFTLEDDDDGD
jgi:hypothetical protein